LGAPAKAALLALGFCTLRASAASFVFVPSADTSLIEIAPNNNNGAQAWLLAGKIQNDVYRNRALIKFDFTSLPTNAIVLSVALNLEVTRVPDEPPADSTFGLRRMLRPWGEGNKFADPGAFPPEPPGQGRPATAGEATWLYAFYPTNAWAIPGGAEGLDYSGIESSFQFIGGLGTYRFESTPELVGDVQHWVNDSASNFGWVLLSNDEITILTARRFASRENLDAPPHLEVDCFVPPSIESAARVGNEFALTFRAWQGQSYAVEFCEDLTAGPWQTLTNLGLVTATIQYTVSDTTAEPRRFYRIVSF